MFKEILRKPRRFTEVNNSDQRTKFATVALTERGRGRSVIVTSRERRSRLGWARHVCILSLIYCRRKLVGRQSTLLCHLRTVDSSLVLSSSWESFRGHLLS
ncbi:hypothetical protein J6590_051796 [Homalodisca vitripennis]|nr:hypothetical protein J6590_051796 [Homalodisca vitripennis]